MASGKTLKLVLYEVLQYAALVVPVFVLMERFACLMRNVKGFDQTAYWLVVAVSIAYVTSVTLLVWVPLKYLILKKRRFNAENAQWRPTALVYLLLCTLPCFGILIASSKVQVDGGHRLDHFTELPVSLVLFSLICVDIIERIRPCRLSGKSDSLEPELEMPSGPVLTHLEPVTTVSGQLHHPDANNDDEVGGPQDTESLEGQPEPPMNNGGPPPPIRWHPPPPRSPPRSPPPTPAGRVSPSSRAASTTYLYYSSSRQRSYSGHLGFLWRRDLRSEVFVDSFLFWFDTVEMVRVAGEQGIFYSVWVFPIYVLAFISTLRMVVTPHNPLLCSVGVALQDVPFLVLRVALIIVFGYVTPLLYPVKNVLVVLTFLYFNYVTRLRVFRSRSLF